MDEDEMADFLYQSDEIDRMIEERAGAFNLNGTNIRNILYVSLILYDVQYIMCNVRNVLYI